MYLSAVFHNKCKQWGTTVQEQPVRENFIKEFQNPSKLQKQECLRIEGAESGEFIGGRKILCQRRKKVSREVVQGLFLYCKIWSKAIVYYFVKDPFHTLFIVEAEVKLNFPWSDKSICLNSDSLLLHEMKIACHSETELILFRFKRIFSGRMSNCFHNSSVRLLICLILLCLSEHSDQWMYWHLVLSEIEMHDWCWQKNLYFYRTRVRSLGMLVSDSLTNSLRDV